MTLPSFLRENGAAVAVIAVVLLFLLARTMWRKEGYRGRGRPDNVWVQPNGSIVINGVTYRPGHPHYSHYRHKYWHLFDNRRNTCNKAACNATMRDWIVNKYWAFGDTAKTWNECRNCASRWFRAPMDVSHDGVNYGNFGSREDAYQAARLDAPPIVPYVEPVVDVPYVAPEVQYVYTQEPYVDPRLANLGATMKQAEGLIEMANRLKTMA